MQVNSVNAYAYTPSFKGAEGTTTEDKKVSKKTVAIAAAAATGAAAIGTTAWALHRGKITLGEDSKFFDKLKEGFMSLVKKENKANFLNAKANKIEAGLEEITEEAKKTRKTDQIKRLRDRATELLNKVSNKKD